MPNILYIIFISPLEFVFDLILKHSSGVLGVSASIFVLSIVVQILSEPLYRLAYKVEKKEKDRQKGVRELLTPLKKQYKGEELLKKTEAVYKEVGFNPLLSFRASMSLFLVIPFFIAAYRVLNNNQIFVNQMFFGIFNLDSPDGLLFGINILPIIMTIFNIIAIHFSDVNKKLLDRENYMLLALTLFFLVYLYNSSSALLLYWTFNNLIYMLKLIVKSRKNI